MTKSQTATRQERDQLMALFNERLEGKHLQEWEKSLWAHCRKAGIAASPRPRDGGLTVCCPCCPPEGIGILDPNPDCAECQDCGFKLLRRPTGWHPQTVAERSPERLTWPTMRPISTDGLRWMEIIHFVSVFPLLSAGRDCGMLYEAWIDERWHYVVRGLAFAHAFRLDGQGHHRLHGSQCAGFPHEGHTVVLPLLDDLMNARYTEFDFCSVRTCIITGSQPAGAAPLAGQRFRVVIHEGDPQSSRIQRTVAAIHAAGGQAEAFACPAALIAEAIAAPQEARGEILTEIFN